MEGRRSRLGDSAAIRKVAAALISAAAHTAAAFVPPLLPGARLASPRACGFFCMPSPFSHAGRKGGCRPAAGPAPLRLSAAALEVGDSVTVVGAASSVGRALARHLLDDGRFQVRLVASDQAADLAAILTGAQVFAGNLAQDAENGSNLNLVSVSAAPGARPRLVSARELLRDSDAVVIAEGTSCFPTPAWLLGLTPANLDARGTRNIISCMQGGKAKRLVYLSCIGAARELSPRFSIPALDANILFWVLNIFGALDAKRMGEGLVRRARGELGVITCIVRRKLHCYESGPAGGLPQDAFDEMQYQAINLVPVSLRPCLGAMRRLCAQQAATRIVLNTQTRGAVAFAVQHKAALCALSVCKVTAC